MYVRVQKVRQGGRVYEYVHIVEGYRDNAGKVRHRVVANLGRRDQLKDSGPLEELASAVALAAIGAFGVDAARLHWDFTSVAFCGAYADQDPGSPRVGFGHSSDHQAHRRQLKVAHATTATGVALFGRVTDGARHEGAHTHELLETLRALAAPRRLLLVADSALVTKPNLTAADAAGIRFVSRLPR